jgi:nucleoside-diphosphate-sugar epimerase
MKILVTGATGYTGGAAAKALRLHGHQVSGFMRPGLVYGNGGSYDIPARKNGVAPRLGSGGTLHGYVHIDKLAELFVLAVERALKGAVLHGVADELNQRDLAAAISRMIGAGDRIESFTLDQMFRTAGSVGIGLSLNK